MRIGQLQMVQSQRMQERRMEIVNANRVLRRFPPEFICAAMDVSLLKPTACDPKRERLPIVIAPVFALGNGKPPKLAGPEHDSRIEQATLLEVHDEGRAWLVRHEAKIFQFLCILLVSIPRLAAEIDL